MPSGQRILKPVRVAARIDDAMVIHTELVSRANGG